MWNPQVDVGFPSVCCECVLLPLVNKEAALAYVREEYSKAENPSRDRGGKKAESGRHHLVDKRGCQNLTGKPQLHGDTQTNRNGLI